MSQHEFFFHKNPEYLEVQICQSMMLLYLSPLTPELELLQESSSCSWPRFQHMENMREDQYLEAFVFFPPPFLFGWNWSAASYYLRDRQCPQPSSSLSSDVKAVASSSAVVVPRDIGISIDQSSARWSFRHFVLRPIIPFITTVSCAKCI